MVELFFQTGSATSARRRFMREGNRRQGPAVGMITRLVRRFRAEGRVLGRGREQGPSGSTLGAADRIRTAITRSPRLSVRKLARRTGVPQTSVHRILRKWLGLHPYKLQRVHGLRRGDKAARVRLCTWLLPKLRSPRFKKLFFMSDEAHFYLNGSVIKQNCRVWGVEPPREAVPHDHYAPHITAWCAVSCEMVIGPYFFWEGGRTVTVTATRYRALLEQFFLPELERRGVPLNKVWLQQDGASAHTTQGVLFYLVETFGVRVVSKGGPVAWPARSPDLTYPDFFLWGWLKTEVYRQLPRSLAQLKQRLRRAARKISPGTLRSMSDALLARCRLCLRERGGSIEHLPRN